MSFTQLLCVCRCFVSLSCRLSVAGCCHFPLRGCGPYWGQIQFTQWVKARFTLDELPAYRRTILCVQMFLLIWSPESATSGCLCYSYTEHTHTHTEHTNWSPCKQSNIKLSDYWMEFGAQTDSTSLVFDKQHHPVAQISTAPAEQHQSKTVRDRIGPDQQVRFSFNVETWNQHVHLEN